MENIMKVFIIIFIITFLFCLFCVFPCWALYPSYNKIKDEDTNYYVIFRNDIEPNPHPTLEPLYIV